MVHDVIASNLQILFCGINPGNMTAQTGHHFARPGNRFWPALFQAGLTPRLFKPADQIDLLPLGIGITNFVTRTSTRADELSREEIQLGRQALEEKVLRITPRNLAILGISTYRIGFNKPQAHVGLQDLKIGSTQVWLFPNPSGLNANYQLADYVKLFKELKATL